MNKFLLVLIGLPAAALLTLIGWRAVNDLNQGMEHPRSEIHAATLKNAIYVAGGIGMFRVLDSCEYFDLGTREWNECPRLPRPLHHVALAASDDRVFASGGYVQLPFEQDRDATLFVLQSNSWAELDKLPHPIGQHAMVYRDEKLYLIGGQNGSQDLDTLWENDLTELKWHKLPSMPTPRHSHAIAMHGDQLFVTGGRSAKLGSEMPIVEMFDFTTNEWSRLPDMPTGRGGHGAAIVGSSLHIFGGESLKDGTVLHKNNVLDLEKLTWRQGKPLDAPRHGFAFAADPKSTDIYIIGGGSKPGWHTIYSVSSTVQKLDTAVLNA